MSKSEDLVISAIVRGAGVKSAMKLGVTSQYFTTRKAEWKFLETHSGVDKQNFKARFPDFRVIKTDADQLEVAVSQLQKDRADLELAKVFSKYQRMFGEVDSKEIAAQASRELGEIIQRYSVGLDVDIYNDNENAYEYVKQRAELLEAGKPIGYPFGVPTLDEAFGGLLAPDLIAILARQGEMKTWLSLFFAVSASLHGAKPMYISLEMDVAQVRLRVHTILSRMLSVTYAKKFKRVFGNMDLMRGRVDLDEYREFLKNAGRYVKRGFIIPDSNTVQSIEQIEAKMEEHKPDVVFYDYFGLAVGEGSIQNWMEAEQFSHGFKNMARRYNIPVILNVQATRKAADSKDGPNLEHIAYTDAIGRDSDRVLSLHLRRGELTCVVKKNRFGPTPTIRFDTDIDKGILDEIVIPGIGKKRRRLQEMEEDE